MPKWAVAAQPQPGELWRGLLGHNRAYGLGQWGVTVDSEGSSCISWAQWSFIRSLRNFTSLSKMFLSDTVLKSGITEPRHSPCPGGALRRKQMHTQISLEQYNECSSQGMDQEHRGRRAARHRMFVWCQNYDTCIACPPNRTALLCSWHEKSVGSTERAHLKKSSLGS